MARLVGTDGRYHRSDHGAAPCGVDARRPRARETERMRPCPECYPPPEVQRTPSVRERAPEVWAAVMARAGGRCEVQRDGCWGWPVSGHHRLRVSQGGEDTVETLVVVCDWCHRLAPDAIHREVGTALAEGLLVSRESGAPLTPWRRRE